jgi:hypothetical protein
MYDNRIRRTGAISETTAIQSEYGSVIENRAGFVRYFAMPVVVNRVIVRNINGISQLAKSSELFGIEVGFCQSIKTDSDGCCVIVGLGNGLFFQRAVGGNKKTVAVNQVMIPDFVPTAFFVPFIYSIKEALSKQIATPIRGTVNENARDKAVRSHECVHGSPPI